MRKAASATAAAALVSRRLPADRSRAFSASQIWALTAQLDGCSFGSTSRRSLTSSTDSQLLIRLGEIILCTESYWTALVNDHLEEA